MRFPESEDEPMCTKLDSNQHRPSDLRDWLKVAWALWWSWAYIQGALAHRFPHLLGWTRHLW